ncbi:hypothetical protein IP90_00977 [Luteimonas cucumeris]|uniref:Helix-turn-helix protein n=1 Tax=Luteimonas cucumeris TaxID=985012 RepID=A0A562LAY8_9GAMM|nr:hypothetical protein [Luteimonas cucumeris]TWI04839.1 hypothetical protein IP90_00977 [Luteimonas cucumeris]
MQTSFPFIAMMPPPKDAPDALISRVSSESEAVAVAMQARGFKQSWYAAHLGKSEAYISQIVNGHRRVPDWFVEPFCVLSGSNLLRQYRDWQEALAMVREQSCARRAIRQMAEQLRAVA